MLHIRSDDKDVQIIGEKVVECGKLEDISARSKKWFKDYKSNRADTFYMSLVLMIKTSQREDLIELYSTLFNFGACDFIYGVDRKYTLSKKLARLMCEMKASRWKLNEVCYKLLKMIAEASGD
ncbi:hypothetical protein Tco_0322854 [Tanacetum coccineum]